MPFFRRNRSDWRVGREIETNVWKHIAWGVLVMLAIATICVAVWYVTRLSALSISIVTVVGGETIPHEEIRASVNEVLRGSYLRLVPYTFTYAVPYETIRQSLMNTPRIRNVEVVRISRNEIKVSFGEYEPYALWCIGATEFSECYFLDENGYAFSIAPPLRGGSLVRHITEGSERLVESQVFDSHLFRRIHNFIEALDSVLGLRVAYVTHTSVGDSTYHISGGGDILAVTDIDVEPILNNLKAILESKEYKHLKPGNFKYIDLRFGKKLFVNESLIETATTGATTTQ